MQRPTTPPHTPTATFLPPVGALALTLGLAAASLAAALYLRYGLIQNTPIGLACEAGERSVTCAVRLVFTTLFGLSVFGWTAIAAALLQLWRPSTLAFAIGLIAACFGIVLYNTRLSALAVALLVLSLARLVSGPAR
jgi:hypothetical protein